MGTSCAPLIAKLYFFFFANKEILWPLFLMIKKLFFFQAFNSTSRYLDDPLNIDNTYLEGMMGQIYPPELQLNKANASDTEAPFLDLHLSISNGLVHPKFMISAMTLILT